MNGWRRYAWCVLWLLPSLAFAADAQSMKLGKDARKSLALTVYNNDFAVVRDVRETVLPQGRIELEFQDVARAIEPSSVMVSDPADQLTVLEQDYRYDLLNRETLLKRYIGRKLKYSRNIFEDARYEKVYREGVLLSTDPEIVKFGDEIEISPEGTISLAYIPESLTTIPTLVWLLDNASRGPRTIETTYVTDNLSWDAEYTLTLNEADRRLDLAAWVSLDNRSGTDYENAKLELVAGNVRKMRAPDTGRSAPESAMMFARAAESVPQQTLQEYHLYSIPRPVDIGNKETKQVRLAAATGIAYKTSYLLESGLQLQPMSGEEQRHFDVHIAFTNDEDNHLGLALPQGRAKVYLRGEKGGLRLVGEDMINDTPDGERVTLTTGTAFDLVAERKQTTFRRLGDRSTEVGYQITVRNRKQEPASVTVREHLDGDWEIVQQNIQGAKVDSNTMDYTLDLDPGQERVVSYTARINR